MSTNAEVSSAANATSVSADDRHADVSVSIADDQTASSVSAAIEPPEATAPVSTVADDDLVVYESTARRSPRFRTAFLGLGFAVLFTGFSVAQGFMTTLHPHDGFFSLATVYLLFALSSLVAPSLVRYFGLRRGMFVAACAYILFVLTENSTSTALLLVISFVNGCGAGLLWNYQGVWLKLVADEGGSIGALTGLFFTITNCSGVSGNALAWGVLVAGYSPQTMIWVMGGVTGLGALLVGCAPPVRGEDAVKRDRTVLSERIRVMRAVSLQPRTVFLMAYMFTQGCGIAFSVGNFPQMFDMDNASVSIAQAFLVYGISCVMFAFICGKLFDRWGWIPLVFFHVCLVYSAFFLLAVFASDHARPASERVATFMICAFLLGAVDSFSNSITNMSLIKLFPDAPAPAFGVYRFFFAMGFTVQACLSTALSYEWMMAFYGLCTALSASMYALLYLVVLPRAAKHLAAPLVSDRQASDEAALGHAMSSV